MTDIILDTDIAAIAATQRPSGLRIRRWLEERHKSGHRNWIYVSQQSDILIQLVTDFDQQKIPDSEKSARKALDSLCQCCMWLSSLSEDAITLEDSDPTAAGLKKAARRTGKSTVVVTRMEKRLDRGLPFVTIESLMDAPIEQREIRMVDLGYQQDRIRSGLERNLHGILHHGGFVQGPEISLLEQRLAHYVGVDECIAVSSGTDALLIALMALGIGSGDEIITTPFSFIATAEVIRLVGATPVYIDVDSRTGNLDATRLEAAIKQTTRLILPVSLYGQCADMTEIMSIADQYHLPVIEDAAQSFGATHHNRKSCGLSTIGCTSFFPSKPLGAYGDAGAIFTADQALAKTMREIRSHGQDSRYHHARLGINGRMDSMQAAVLLEKLLIIDDELDRHQKIADGYNEALNDLESQTDLMLPFICDANRSAWAQYTIQVPGRDVIVKMLSEAGIPTAVHYPNVVFRQPAFLCDIDDCPNSIDLANKVMSIPMHPYLSTDMQRVIVECLYSSIN